MKKIYLINSLEEYFFVRKLDQNSRIVCSDYLTGAQILPYEKISNIYDFSEKHSINKPDIWKIVSQFYRDKNGICPDNDSNFSVPQSLSWNNSILITKLIRDFFAYLPLSNEETYIFNSSDPNFIYFHQYFNKSSHILKSPSSQIYRDYGGLRILSYDYDHWIYKYKLTNLLRFLQNLLIRKKIKNKVIVFFDWTHEGSKFIIDKIITKPSFQLYKTAYFILKKRSTYEPDFSKDVTSFTNFRYMFGPILRHPDLTKICYRKLAENYTKNYRMIKDVFEIHKDMVDFYEPSEIIFPSYAWDYYISLAQYLNKREIDCSVVIDGFPLDKAVTHRIFNSDNTKPLIKTHYSQSNYIYKENLKNDLYSTEYRKITPLLAEQYSKKIKVCESSKVLDAIILTYSHDDTNPHSRPDLSGKILFDVISMLLNLNFHNIGIKIKGPRERRYVEDVVNFYKNQCNIQIFDGKFNSVINNSKLFIGGISSAAYECMLNNAQYYLYEPASNGYGDDEIIKNILSDFYTIPRSIDQLKHNISNQLYLRAPRYLHDDLFS